MNALIVDYENPEDMKWALIQAADGHLDWVQDLLDHGADPNGMPFIMAIQCNEPEIVQLMIDAGADVNQDFASTTPLVHAVSSTNLEIVKILIAAGANVDKVDQNGCSPIFAAKFTGRTNATKQEKKEILQVLTNAGAMES